MVFEAMQDIEFNFSKIGEEELKLASGGEELNEKKNKANRRMIPYRKYAKADADRRQWAR